MRFRACQATARAWLNQSAWARLSESARRTQFKFAEERNFILSRINHPLVPVDQRRVILERRNGRTLALEASRAA